MAWTSPRTWVTGELVTAAMFNEQMRDNLKAVAAVGDLKFATRVATAIETLVDGAWLECNGVAVSRTTYATLFNYLNGLTPALPFGTGDGSTTFNLPDFRGRVPIHAGTHTDVDALGESDGESVGNRRPKHTHTHNLSVGFQDTTLTSGGGQTALFDDGGDRSVNVGGGGIGPAANRPTDAPAYLVGGVWLIKAVT